MLGVGSKRVELWMLKLLLELSCMTGIRVCLLGTLILKYRHKHDVNDNL